MKVNNSGKGLCIGVTLDCAAFAFMNFNIEHAQWFDKSYKPLDVAPSQIAIFVCEKVSDSAAGAKYEIHASEEKIKYGQAAQEFVDNLPAIAKSLLRVTQPLSVTA